MKRKASRGIITVFVTLIMVPVVAFTGTMVDVARLKLYSSQAAMAADTYAEMALSEYDNLLKELYGLFAVTQNEDGLQAIEDYAKYINYSFNPSGDGVVTEGFMPYQSAAVNVSYAVLENSALSETNILMTQISEFMKFRVVQSVLEQTGVIDSLNKFEDMSSDMEVVEARNNITAESATTLTMIEEYYKVLVCIEAYALYAKTKEFNYKNYASKLDEIGNSEEYAKYVNYLNNKTAIDAAKQRVAEAEAAVAAYEEQLATQATQPSAETSTETSAEASTDTSTDTAGGAEMTLPAPPAGPSDADKALADQYVDVAAYVSYINDELDDDKINNVGDLICFGQVEGRVEQLATLAGQLDTSLQSITENINILNEKLASCSDENLKKGIKEEIGLLADIATLKDDFVETVNLLKEHDNAEMDLQNSLMWELETAQLMKQKNSLIDGKGITGDYKKEIEFEWYDITDDKEEFIEALHAFCYEESSNVGSKKKVQDKIDKAKTANDKKISKLEKEKMPEARDIPEGISKELKDSGSKASIPNLGDFVMGGTNFSTIATGALDKFLVAEYAYGMFSSRVTGLDPNTDKIPSSESGNEDGNGSEGYVDESLTGIEMSKDINYLYGAELEYLIAGYDDSDKNLYYTFVVVCGIRTTMNYISTYTIDEVDSTISNIAKLVSDAVLATGVGAPAAALIRVGLSGALRLGVAVAETMNDWEDLKNRKKVIFYKSELDDMTAYVEVKEFLESYGMTLPGAPSGKEEGAVTDGVDSGGKEKGKFAMSYEDYLFVLMVLFTNSDNLVGRTANLITLNVNHSQNEGDKLESLDFKMSEAYTAVESSCDVNLKFVIVPDNFVNMFVSDDTKAIIQKLDNGGYGYSVIRGY